MDKRVLKSSIGIFIFVFAFLIGSYCGAQYRHWFYSDITEDVMRWIEEENYAVYGSNMEANYCEMYGGKLRVYLMPKVMDKAWDILNESVIKDRLEKDDVIFEVRKPKPKEGS